MILLNVYLLPDEFWQLTMDSESQDSIAQVSENSKDFPLESTENSMWLRN